MSKTEISLKPRKMVRHGGSLLISLPKIWTQFHELKPGQLLEAFWNTENNTLSLKITGEEE